MRALVVAVLLAGAGAAPSPAVVRVGPGDDLAAAIEAADAGTVVELTAGSHRPEPLTRGDGDVTVRAAPGADVVLGPLDVRVPGLRLEGLRLTGRIHLRPRAVGSVLHDVVVDGGSVVVDADGVVVEGSVVTPAPDHDALVVTASDGDGPVGVVVRGNELGPAVLSSPSSEAHLDCLQVTSAQDLLIEGNVLLGCSAQTILVKSDLGPVDGVVLRGNEVHGCEPQRDTCRSINVLQVVPGEHPMGSVLLEGNTVHGRLRIDPRVTGARVEGNAAAAIVDSCHAVGTGNVFGEARCEVPEGNEVVGPAWLEAAAPPTTIALPAPAPAPVPAPAPEPAPTPDEPARPWAAVVLAAIAASGATAVLVSRRRR